MRKRFSSYKDKLVKRLILSYVFLLLLSLIMGINLYTIGVGVIKEEIKQSKIFTLTQAKNMVDNELKAIESLAYQMATNPKLNELLRARVRRSTFYLEAKETIEQLASYTTNIQFVESYYVYLKNTDYIITPDTLYDPKIYYDFILGYEKSKYEEWYEMISKKKYQGTFLTLNEWVEKENRFVTYVQAIPITYNNYQQGSICIQFNKSKLINLFSSLELGDEGFIYIENNKGEKVLGISKNPDIFNKNVTSYLLTEENFYSAKINGQDMIITSVSSDVSGWNYYIALPSTLALEKLEHYQRIYLFIIFVFVFIGAIIAVFLTYKNSSPLINIAKQLTDFTKGMVQEKSKDTIHVIGSSIKHLISENTILQEGIKEQEPFIYAAYLDKLLKGLIYSKKEVEAITNYLNLDLSYQNMTVLYVTINQDDTILDIDQNHIQEMAIYKALTKNTFYYYFGDHTLIQESDHQALSIIISSDDDPKAFMTHIQNKIKAIQAELKNKYEFTILVGASEIYTDLLYTWQAYEQAYEAINYNIDNDRTLIWYHTIPKDSGMYYYPLDLEQHLINFVRIGETKQAISILQRVYEENFKLRNLSLEMTKYLISDLKSTMVKITSQIPNATKIIDITKIDKNNSIKENFDLFEEMCTNLSELVNHQKSDQKEDLITKIKQYIDDNYMDADLGLQKMAEEFNLSEGYFSHLFKEKTGINFTDYLEKVRMDKALELLKETNISITSISELVGYNSAQSFRRAFKRICGLSPTAARKNPAEKDK
ncbi:MAG: AraC family transcriptional regulator [Epulopiscium sp.]|nr:AraC family transcriptional regulator [Candidatus Epulonipiscium sp.]